MRLGPKRQYLWFVLLSPLALPLFRRWPLPTLAVPIAALVAMELGVPRVPVLKEFAIFFGCWLIGFAHHDGRLRRMNRWLLVSLAVAASGLGAAWFLMHPSHRGFDLNDIPLGDALWSRFNAPREQQLWYHRPGQQIGAIEHREHHAEHHEAVLEPVVDAGDLDVRPHAATPDGPDLSDSG